METQDFKKLKGISSIAAQGEFIIAYGKGVYILNTKGEVLTQRKDLGNVFKIAFLSDNMIIADCGRLKEYVLISLPTGKDVGRIKQPKMDYSYLKFLVSENGKFVYDYYLLKNEYYIAKIDIEQMQILFFPLQLGLRATADFILDENEVLCFLQTQIEEIANQTYCCSGIRYEYFDTAMGYGSAYYWKAKWTFDHPRQSCQFLGCANKIITSDLYEYDPIKDSSTFLLENDSHHWDLERTFSLCRLTRDGRYIIVYYSKSNVIIDRKEKRIVARYYTDPRQGCIIENQYWLATNDGIICKPFPQIEGQPKDGGRLSVFRPEP